MKSVTAKTILTDFDFVSMTMGSEDEQFMNALLVPMVRLLPAELYDDMENLWVIFNSDETDSSKCYIELVYDGLVYRRINPFTEKVITCLFEERISIGEDHEIMLLWKLFSKVRFEFIWASVVKESKNDAELKLLKYQSQMQYIQIEAQHQKMLADRNMKIWK